MTGRLEGRTVLVVGAGTQLIDDPDAPTGNGRAISVTAAREGANVICADIDQGAAALTAELVEAEGAKAQVVVGDVSDESACESIIAEAFSGLGNISGVVLNVGTGRGNPQGGIAGTTAADWDFTFAANLRSHFLLTRAAFAHLGEGTSVVFIGSVAGLRPGSRLPAYDTSKAGLVGLNRYVALEGARHGIRSNLIAPGLIDTPLGRAASAGRPSRTRVPVPLGRQGTAWEVAEATVFLLSDAASYITGQVLAVDGGLTLL